MKSFSVTALFVLVISGTCSAQSNDWHIERTIHIGGKGRWDYLAVNNGKLYVSHDSLVNVVDEFTGDSITTIPGAFGVHGIAFVPELNKGFITAGRLNAVIVFDLQTTMVTGSIKTAEGPDAIIYEPFSKKIIVCAGRGKQADIIDPTSGKLTDSIQLQGKPEEPASDGAGNIYVNLEDKSEVVHIDAKTFKILDRWKIGNGEAPTGLAIDREHKRLFIGCDNRLMVVMDATNGKIVAELPTGDGCDGAAFDPESACSFSPNGEGTLTIIHEETPDKFTVVKTVTTKKGARTIALDAQHHLLFLPTADYGEPPAPSNDNVHPRPAILPGTFQVLVISK